VYGSAARTGNAVDPHWMREQLFAHAAHMPRLVGSLASRCALQFKALSFKARSTSRKRDR
jgi:hypothetical protein